MKVSLMITLFLLISVSGCKLKRQVNEFNNQHALLDSLRQVMQQQRGNMIATHDYHSDTLYAKLNLIQHDAQLDTLQMDADSAEEFINTLKNKIQIESAGEGDMATPTRIMIREGNAAILKSKLTNLESLMRNLNTGDSIVIDLFSEVPAQVNVSWENYNFDRVPVIAVLTILTKYQQDIARLEHDLLTHLFIFRSTFRSQIQDGLK